MQLTTTKFETSTRKEMKMASIATDQNGRRRILFIAPDGRRPTVRLGKVSQRAAESVKHRVEQLLECKMLNRPMEADLV
jgi:hypothetical protein